MDKLDLKMLQILMKYGRATWSDLASEVDMSSPAVAERVRRLEEKGVIKAYEALINPELVGNTCTAFVAVTLEQTRQRAHFLNLIQSMGEVQECHHIAGDYDYLLKVRARDTKDLDRVISSELKKLPGVKTRTTIVMNSLKETAQIPIHADRFS
ncbi:Lrp/AsnC family transcriptional regulator [Sporolactobacillus sp. CPB3-1]|uniref:Lrp/AsnC family transcriptional regulator n=1 Tax=Sporolactobacillus mangiferae TaxID=2940498 RepID=A0ABT0MDP2_9BACL|nr:Lrp/AsnC family transcriptional regulator [Sporolactobacillus mangiferae]MCL1632698.1 Lrp/AsnC family transcriptional regulator [Sporolactobacillus mangiferae]